jgi:uncharacterized protein with GYD domain
VASDADGDFVVVWQSFLSPGTDLSSWSVQARRYASDGSAIGGQFQVNTYTTLGQYPTGVAMDADGDFVVVWQSDLSGGTDLSYSSIQAQRFASNGSMAGGQFQVNTYTTMGQYQPSVAVDADGDFVVVWVGLGSGGLPASLDVHGQRYASDGSVAGGEFQINTYTTNDQFLPRVALDAAGDFVVVWTSNGSPGTDSSSFSIQGRRFSSSGASVGGQFQVNVYTTDSQASSAVASDAVGDFVVVWHGDGSAGTDTSDASVHARRYASDGTAVGGEIQVNTYTNLDQQQPSVAADADGDFVVVWHSAGSAGSDSSSWSGHGQRYASDGSTIGGELQINTYTTSSQRAAWVAIDAVGEFVVAWQSYGSGGSDTVRYSIQKSDTATVPVELFSFTVE